MNTFTLQLNDIAQHLQLDNVCSFIGRDASGSFGLQAGHEAFMTCLEPGLARFHDAQKQWHYIAQPGAVVLFVDNVLQLSTTQLFVSDDRDSLLEQLDAQWHVADQQLGSAKRTITTVEQALARKLWEMNRQGVTL